MRLGIQAKIRKTDDYFLKNLFDCIDLSRKKYYVDNQQAWSNAKSNTNLFNKNIYHYNEFNEVINAKADLIMLLSIISFPESSNAKVNSLEDYINSDAIFAMFIVDGYSIEIYCKDELMCNIFANNLQRLDCMNIGDVMQSNITRSQFYL